jgi:FAD/FMN-containing dehydrogenase
MCLDRAKDEKPNIPFVYVKAKPSRILGVIRVKSVDELKEVIDECLSKEIPMIPLGSGTTNFAQLIPLKPSVYIDVSEIKGITSFDENEISVLPGTNIGDVLEYLRKRGKSIPVYPSSYNMSTIGGFIEGGSGGIGSFKYGTHFRVLLKEATLYAGETIKLRGEKVLVVTHAWGTTGFLTEVKLNLTDYKENKLQYFEVNRTDELKDKILSLYKIRDKVNLVSIYNDKLFSKLFKEEVKKRWVIVTSSEISLGSEIGKDERISFASTIQWDLKWFHQPLTLDSIKVLDKVKEGLIHAEVIRENNSPLVLVDHFSTTSPFEEVSFLTIKERLKNLDPELVKYIEKFKKEIDPKDLFNPLKI